MSKDFIFGTVVVMVCLSFHLVLLVGTFYFTTGNSVTTLFYMGSTNEDPLVQSDEQPTHTVYLDGYWIGRTEVTNAQYIRCIEAEDCDPPNNNRYENPNLANHPVTNVDWFQAKTYVEWVGGRLPTEAQWEKACRGTSGRIYPFLGNKKRLNNAITCLTQP